MATRGQLENVRFLYDALSSCLLFIGILLKKQCLLYNTSLVFSIVFVWVSLSLYHSKCTHIYITKETFKNLRQHIYHNTTRSKHYLQCTLYIHNDSTLYLPPCKKYRKRGLWGPGAAA